MKDKLLAFVIVFLGLSLCSWISYTKGKQACRAEIVRLELDKVEARAGAMQ